MYADPFAVKKFEELSKGNHTIFETGTWKGDGTLFFLKYKDEVITCEYDPIYYVKAHENWESKGFKPVFRGEFTAKDKTQFMTIFEKADKRIYSFMGNSPDTIKIVCHRGHTF